MREFVILVVALIVAGAMLGTLTWFFRRLRSIEESLGMALDPPLGTQIRDAGAHLMRGMRRR